MYTFQTILAFLYQQLLGNFIFYANPADEWSGADLTGVARGGQIREDAMEKIWDISNVPLEVMDRLGNDAVGNAAFEDVWPASTDIPWLKTVKAMTQWLGSVRIIMRKSAPKMSALPRAPGTATLLAGPMNWHTRSRAVKSACAEIVTQF